MKFALGILALALLAGTARADSTWTYAGNSTEGQTGGQVNLCGCALSGSFTLDGSGNVLAYSFTDSIVTLNQSDSTVQLYDWLGTLGGWSLRITASNGDFLGSQFYGSVGEATDSGTGGLDVEGNRGVWSDPISQISDKVPEPGTFALVGLGLAALAFLRRLA